MRIENLFHSAVIVVFLATLPTARGAQDGPKTIVVRAGRIHTLTGDAIDDGAVVIRDGKIVSVGPLADAPPDAEIIELRDSVITPGLIDAHAAIDQEIRQAPGGAPRRRSFWQDLADAAVRQHDHAAGEEQEDPVCAICAADPSRAPLVCPQKALHELTMTTGCPVCNYPNNLTAAVGVGAGESWAEHSSEVTPHLNVIDSVNFLSTDFDRLLRGGVTTVWVSPDSGSVIGMRGAIVKTGGPLGSRIVREAGAVKAAMGRDPVVRGIRNRTPRPESRGGVGFTTRRPNTRMGVHWVFRKAFYDAMRYSRGLPIHGADMPPIEAVPNLMKILEGEIPLRIQARAQHDILLAIRLAKEFGLLGEGRVPFLLEEATEAYVCLDQLKAANVPVIFGPIFSQPSGYRARASGEASDPRLNTAARLIDAGIVTAITAHDMRDEEGLIRQAMMAARYGVSAEAALRAVTSTPAELMNLKGKVGTLSPGADADLVIWSAEPLDAAGRVLLVMIDGRVVYRVKN